MNKFKKISLFIAVIFILSAIFPFFILNNKNETEASAEFRLTKGVKVKNPALGQDFIVWNEYRDGAYNIYLYNFVTKKEIKINKEAVSFDAIGPVVFQNHIYWVDHSVSGWDFIDYNIDRQPAVKVFTENRQVFSLDAYENYLVYEAKGNDYSDVFVLNKNSAPLESKNITNDQIEQKFPTIFGNYIAWSEFSIICKAASSAVQTCALSKYGRVITYDLISGARNIIADNVENLSNAKMKYLAVAWSQMEAAVNTVKVYYINTGKYINVSPYNTYSYNPVISADAILFYINRSGKIDLDLYQFSTGKYTALSWTSAEKSQITLGASANLAAWVDNRLGTADIYYYDAAAEKVKNDQDGDGVDDETEAKYGTNSFDSDTDRDGLTDYEEIYRYHTFPTQYDSDGDGITDGEEINNWLSNPLKFDSNDDGIDDKTSIIQGYNPIGNRAKIIAYRAPRMDNLDEEKQLAVYLRNALDNYLGRGKWHTKNNQGWFNVVNAYIYGGYNIKEIGDYIKGNADAINRETLAEVWREELRLRDLAAK